MFKKSVILGLVLLLAGAGLLGWVLTEQKKEKQLQQEQREKFKSTLSKLNKIVGGEINVGHFGDIAHDENHQQESEKYKSREETRGLILSLSGVFTLTGGTILSWWLLLWTARLLIRGFMRLTKFSADFLKSRTTTRNKQPTTPDEKKSEQEQAPHERQSQVEKHSKVLVNSGWQNFNKNSANRQEEALSQTGFCKKSSGTAKERDHKDEKGRLGSNSTKNSKGAVKADNPTLGKQRLAVQHCDKGPAESEQPAKVNVEKSSVKPEDSLKAQTERLEKRMAESGQTAGRLRVQQTALENARPVEDSLKELSQQVSAIRDYAANQQERVRKLQDGYDWNITRNFCLRVIRCVDNLDNRINSLSEQDIDTTDLEVVRDELVFALESTGVEQFEPEINSNYRGQEKNTEAVKEKQDCDDPKLTGKIARVIRRGYQYFIDEENVKIVRPAQVKLFG